jgi:hypothetical protein
MVRKVAIFICAFIFLVSCSKEFREDFKNLFPLREALIKEFEVKDVRAVIQNGNCIGVSFINSKYNTEPEKIQEKVRQRTLELISSSYPDNDRINMAWVSFVKHKNYFFVFNYTDSTNTRFYNKSQDGSWVTF